MRRHAHRQQHRALGAAGLRGIDRTRDGRRIARDDRLPGRIEVHRFDDFALRRFPAGGVEIRVLEPEDCRHRALPQRHGLLHHLAAEADEVDGRPEVHRVASTPARCTRRGCVPPWPRVAVRHDRPRPARSRPRLPASPAACAPWRRDRPRALLAQRPEVVAEHVARFGKGCAHDGFRRAECGEHADGLRPLARKDESQCHRQCSPVDRPAAVLIWRAIIAMRAAVAAAAASQSAASAPADRAIGMRLVDDRHRQRRGRERQRPHEVLPGELGREQDRHERGEGIAACANHAQSPAAIRPCSTPENPTYQSSSGSNTRNPRSIATVEATRTTIQPRRSNSRAKSQATSARPTRFQARCARSEWTRCAVTSRQDSPPQHGGALVAQRLQARRAEQLDRDQHQCERQRRAPGACARCASRTSCERRPSSCGAGPAAWICYDQRNLPPTTALHMTFTGIAPPSAASR